MSQIRAIARLTIVEAIHNRIGYGALTFLIIMLLAAAALASVTMGRTELMILDLGLGGISILGNLMAITLTIQSLQQEKEGRTLYVLLTRLPHRWQYVMGKFVGLATVLAGQLMLMCMILGAIATAFGHFFWLSFLQASLATILEVWLITAIAIIFSQTSSLFLAVLYTLSFDVAGRFTSVIRQFGENSDSATLQQLTQAIYYILPNFEALNLRQAAGYIASYPLDRLWSVTAYGFTELAFVLMVAVAIFERRNLS